MIFEHEIPQGSKLHFGAAAKIKRELESKACDIFYKNGFEEIITPSFCYLEHQQNVSNRHIIRLSSQNNHQISLRYDSTLDVIRIITKRLGRSTQHDKWFYIQPVFSYPTSEIYQIGAECLNIKEFMNLINMGIEILDSAKLNTTLQISSVRVSNLCLKELNLDSFKGLSLENLMNKASFIKELLELDSIQSLDSYLDKSPMFLRFELERVSEFAHTCKHKKIIISPLLKPVVEYYDDLIFKVFCFNQTLLLGGNYKVEKNECCGFGIYSDSVVELMLKKD